MKRRTRREKDGNKRYYFLIGACAKNSISDYSPSQLVYDDLQFKETEKSIRIVLARTVLTSILLSCQTLLFYRPAKDVPKV